jgi:hypothetical protein
MSIYKNLKFCFMRIIGLFFFLCVTLSAVDAQSLVENFEKAPAGENLEGYNGWTVTTVAAEAVGSSSKIKAGALAYKGYKASESGNSIELLKSEKGRTSVKPTGLTIPDVGGSVYAAFLVNVGEIQGTANFRELISFDQSKENSWYRARVLVKYEVETKKLLYAIVKGSTKPEVVEASTTNAIQLPLNAGETQLLVLRYTSVDGKNNDEVSLYINPDLSVPEGKQKNVVNAADNAETADYSKGSAFKIAIRQRSVSAQISGLIVSNSWNDFVESGKKKKK